MRNVGLAAVGLSLVACGSGGSTGATEAADGGAGGGGPDAGAAVGVDAAPEPASCEGMSPQPVDQIVTIASGGLDRTFRVHVPASYEPQVATPVVLNFHGLTSNAAQQEAFSGMAAKADEAGFIAVHPEGVAASWNGGGCCGEAGQTGVDDVGFVEDVLAELETMVCVDRKRIYATGMSNGGFMSHRLACELSERLAAIAPVAGLNAASPCAPARAIPVLQIHGTGDTVVSYSGVAPTMEAWAERNGCGGETEVVFDNGTATCASYLGCPAGVEVTTCTLQGFGHWWPGAFGATADLIATDAIWDFFASHALP